MTHLPRALTFAPNGADRPLHQDRQVLRAEDLALEQSTQDALLARARRYLHGWGVVAGFSPAVHEGGAVSVGPGYGVTPLGDELFLADVVSLSDVDDRAVACCGPGPLGCAIVDPEALAEARRAAADVTVTAWLIARPASREAAPRPGVPEGCAHPASTLLPSRRCAGVEFAILCTLPPSHQPPARDCAALASFVCGVRRREGAPLPWETPLEPEANFLVIAELTVTRGALTVATERRRTLWPVALIQDWIAACLCPLLARLERVPDDDELAPLTLAGERVPLPREAVLALRKRLGGPVDRLTGIDELRAQALARLGISTEGEFLTTRPERLAAALNLPLAEVTALKDELNQRHDLGLTFR